MYLAAVRLDAEGDKLQARTLYLEVMTRFPNDDLAIDAANRLTSLADLATREKQHAAKNVKNAAAIKAAEARATAAERAAKRAADEAKKQRAAREAEARRADQARRDAEAARTSAQNAANTRAHEQAESRQRRNSACDHLTPGLRFTINGGGFFGIGDATYTVIGISREGGIATGRLLGTDIQNQFSCSRIN